jgi:hypothetical protein
VCHYKIHHEEVRDRRGTAKLQGFLNARIGLPHTPATLSLREKIQAPIRYDARWAPNPVWILDDQNLISLWESQPDFSFVQPVAYRMGLANEYPTFLSRDTSDLFHRNCACDCWWWNRHPYTEVSELDRSSACVCTKMYVTASFWKPEVRFPPCAGKFRIVTTFLPALDLLSRLAFGTGTLSTLVIRNVRARFSMLRCLVVWVLFSSSQMNILQEVSCT